MNAQLRKEILTFLTPLPSLQAEKGRQTILLAAGLDAVLTHIDLSGTTREVVTGLVHALEHYGATATGELALIAFLREMATYVGGDKQTAIQQFCERILADPQDKNTRTIQHLTMYTSSHAIEEPPPVSTDIAPNPYKGLSAFQETDADRFFGRERVIQALWDRVCAWHVHPLDDSIPLRLLAILGPSGSGKSSVARAGLLPQLAAHLCAGSQDQRMEHSDPERVRVVVFTPGPHPLDALSVMLARIDPHPQTVAKTASETLELTKVLSQETNGKWEGLRRIADTLPDIATQPLILLIDQFEEVYTKNVEPDERRQFLDNILCAAADSSGHVSVILTLRSDFLGQTQGHPAFNQAITAHHEIVPVMNDAELRQAIAMPAEHAGHELDAATVDLLIEQSHDREGALPLLQFALTRIWDGLVDRVSPADTLKNIGGVGGALAGEAQRLFDRLNEADQNIISLSPNHWQRMQGVNILRVTFPNRPRY